MEAFNNLLMDMEVKIFAKNLFYILKEQVYHLTNHCKCRICLGKVRFPFSGNLSEIVREVLCASLIHRKKFRKWIHVISPQNYTIDAKEEKQYRKSISEVVKIEKGGLIFTLSVISEAYLSRYVKLRQFNKIDPCVVYLDSACKCFEKIYKKIPKWKYDDYRAFLKDREFSEDDLNKGEQLRKKHDRPYKKNVIKEIESKGNLTSFTYSSIRIENLVDLFEVVYEFADAFDIEGILDGQLSKVSEMYKSFYETLAPNSNCTLLSYNRDLGKDVNKITTTSSAFLNFKTKKMRAIHLPIQLDSSDIVKSKVPSQNKNPISIKSEDSISKNKKKARERKKILAVNEGNCAEQTYTKNIKDEIRGAIEMNDKNLDSMVIKKTAEDQTIPDPSKFENQEYKIIMKDNPSPSKEKVAESNGTLLPYIKDSGKDVKKNTSSTPINFLAEELGAIQLDSSDTVKSQVPSQDENPILIKSEDSISMNKKKTRKRKKKLAKNEVNCAEPTGAENHVQDEIRGANEMKDKNLDSVEIQKPVEDQKIPHPSEDHEWISKMEPKYPLKNFIKSLNEVLYPPKVLDVKRFARDLFYYLKEVFNLRKDCKCEVCLDKDVVTSSGFTPSVGADVYNFSLAKRNNYRYIARTELLQNFDPVLTLEEKRKIWKNILPWAKHLADHYGSVFGIICVFGLVSEVFLFRYLRLRKNKYSNPCVDYQKVTLSCFLYIYNDVFRSKKDDLGNLLKHWEDGEETQAQKTLLEVQRKKEKYCEEEQKLREKLKKSPKSECRNRSVTEELEPEFLKACDFVESLSNKEEGDIEENRLKLFSNYDKFFKKFDRKYGDSFSLMGNYKPFEVENLIKAKNIAQLEAETPVTVGTINRIVAKELYSNLVEDRCPVIDHIWRFLNVDRSRTRCPGGSPEEFAMEFFYYLKKIFKLNYDCRCENCIVYEEVIPPVPKAIIVGNVLTLSFTDRKRLRATINNRISKHFNPTMRQEDEESIWKEISTINKEQSLENTYLLSLISETYLYRYVKMRQYCEIDPCEVYLKAAYSCFVYVFENSCNVKLKDFKTHILHLELQYRVDECRQLVFDVYNDFTGGKEINSPEINRSWLRLILVHKKLPHHLILARQIVDALDKKQTLDIDCVYNETQKKYSELYEKTASIKRGHSSLDLILKENS